MFCVCVIALFMLSCVFLIRVFFVSVCSFVLLLIEFAAYVLLSCVVVVVCFGVRFISRILCVFLGVCIFVLFDDACSFCCVISLSFCVAFLVVAHSLFLFVLFVLLLCDMVVSLLFYLLSFLLSLLCFS